MFTGIVEELGTIKKLSISGHSGQIMIKASKVLEGTIIGDSIAVNGICLTVTSMGSDYFTASKMRLQATTSIWNVQWQQTAGLADILFPGTLTEQAP